MNVVQTQPARQYRPDIDGLRAVAILSVVLYHAHVPFVLGGFTGVDIFFVISVTSRGHIFSDLSAGTFSYLQFYRLRAKRILPAFFCMLAVTLLAALLLLSPYEARDFARSALTATLSVSNIYFWKYVDYFQGPSEFNPLLMTWSLGVEEQFYAVIPLLLVLLARIRRSLILPTILIICALSLLYAWHQFPIQPLFVFFMLPARAWELGVGVALAIAELTRKRAFLPAPLANLFSIAGMALMLAPVVLLNPDSQFPGIIPLSTVLGTALIIPFPASWINRRLLSLSPLVFIGRTSYSWYLWHWPVLAFLRVISQRELPPVAAATAVVFSLALAIASYFFIEQPFRKSTRAPAPLLFRYALLGVPFLAASVILWRTDGLPQRYPDLLQLSNENRAYETDPCLATIGIDKFDFAPPCYPASGNRPIVALWGDSHGSALAPAIRPIANSAGYDLAQLTRSACRPEGDAATLEDFSCSQFNRQVIDRLRQDPRIRIVMIADAWGHMNLQPSEVLPSQSAPSNPRPGGTTAAAKNSPMQFLQASIQSLQSSGKKVIVFGDVPSFDTDPFAQFWTNRIPVRRTIANWIGVPKTADAAPPSVSSASNNAQAAALLHDALASLPGVTYVDLKHSLCNQSGACAYSKDGRMLYFDHQHVTPDGARYVLKDFHLSPSTQ
jgi:peptidoglycan/LPS O-acetylase OafA/YrhL